MTDDEKQRQLERQKRIYRNVNRGLKELERGMTTFLHEAHNTLQSADELEEVITMLLISFLVGVIENNVSYVESQENFDLYLEHVFTRTSEELAARKEARRH